MILDNLSYGSAIESRNSHPEHQVAWRWGNGDVPEDLFRDFNNSARMWLHEYSQMKLEEQLMQKLSGDRSKTDWYLTVAV